MRKLFLVTVATLAASVPVFGATPSPEGTEFSETIGFIEKYAERQCRPDGDFCMYIGPLAVGDLEFAIPNKPREKRPVIFHVQLLVKGGVRDVEIQIQTELPSNPGIPDLILMVDRGGDGTLDSLIVIPIVTVSDGVHAQTAVFPRGCWDSERPPFCRRIISDAEMEGFRRLYQGAIHATLGSYQQATTTSPRGKI